MKSPRNEREAQPHLQAQADLHYRRTERRLVQPSYQPRKVRRYFAVALVLLGTALAGVGYLWVATFFGGFR